MQSMNDLLNLCEVPRWSVCRMRRQQTVAEHSFRVAVIASHLGDVLKYHDTRIVFWALLHDAPEAYSGDSPSPFKEAVGRQIVNHASNLMLPWFNEVHAATPNTVKAIVKLADHIEAYTWWQIHGDQNMPHPWIQADGPVGATQQVVIDACRTFAWLLTAGDESLLITEVLAICNSILGVPRSE